MGIVENNCMHMHSFIVRHIGCVINGARGL